jgi:lysophospholipase L1-like esterase
MKTILCYGDSNSWGNIAGSFDSNIMLHKRYDYGIRWTSILPTLLGSDYYVIEENLNGRSTSFDEIGMDRPSRNGLLTLPGILEMHYPIDCVIFMLGTNDTKIQYNASVERIVEGMRNLIHVVKSSRFGRNFEAPNILLMSPASIFKIDSSLFELFFNKESIQKSQQLAAHYEKLAQEEDCSFLDIGPLVEISAKDGIHLDEKSHMPLAQAVAQKIKALENLNEHTL